MILRTGILAAPLLLGVGAASAQVDEPEPEAEPAPDLRFFVDAGYQLVFDSDLSTGEFGVQRLAAEIKYKAPITQQLHFQVRGRYLFDDYDFSGASALGSNPWEGISTFTLDGGLEWWANRDTAVWLGAAALYAGEDGASFDDSVIGGGYLGVTFVQSRTLIWGGGIGVLSQLDEDVLVYPILTLDWTINDRTKVSTVSGPAGLAFTGAELSFDLGGGWEVGTGFRYEFRRFRLDDSGVAPGGVGEDAGWPIWARVSYNFSPNFELDMYGGYVAAGTLTIDDFNGIELGEEDYNAPMVALALRIRF